MPSSVYFFVLMPNIVYKGQKLNSAVKIGTIPIKPINLIPPSRIKSNDKSAIPMIILITRSTEPTFAFIVIPPFLHDFTFCKSITISSLYLYGYIVNVLNLLSLPYFLSNKTRDKVAIGPNKIDNKNQFNPLLFFPCAIPALISASVPQPTKYPSFILDFLPIIYVHSFIYTIQLYIVS